MHTPFSLRQLFSTLFILFVGFFAAAALQAWTGPTATAPDGNVAAPINVGTTDQVKNAGISVNSLAVFGSQYIQDKLGIGVVSPVVSIETPGTIKIGNGGEVCQAVTEGAQRYNTSSNIMEYCDGASWNPISDTSGTIVPDELCLNGTCKSEWPATYTPQTRVVTGQWAARTASCASDEVVVGGGGYCSSQDGAYLVSSGPTGAGGVLQVGQTGTNGWQIECAPGSSSYATAYAVCLKK